ncbi:hypothetical protein AB0H69_07450 [Streptomyces phaeochromogenes]|uniref:hypothetical protein n=1 Tax=Streptomyces phaeochromogenes TaxID=1923 RepID=UPI0033E102C1
MYVSEMRRIAILYAATTLSAGLPLALGLGIGEKAALASLTVVGAAATIGGLLWGARELRAEYRALKWQTRGLELVTQSDMPSEEQERHRRLILPPSSTGLDVLYVRQLVRLHILEHAAQNLGAPLALTLLGVVGSTGASVWSLWA